MSIMMDERTDGRQVGGSGPWPVRGVRAMGRGLALAALAPWEVLLFCLVVTAISLLGVGLGVLLVPALAVALRGPRRSPGGWPGSGRGSGSRTRTGRSRLPSRASRA
ncbi:hypothetical protein SAZ11_36300 [Streptomyces sp. FXJ1.4098]|nr:hypothetical protein [Streptomyces sp. FXJ1.4098]